MAEPKKKKDEISRRITTSQTRINLIERIQKGLRKHERISNVREESNKIAEPRNIFPREQVLRHTNFQIVITRTPRIELTLQVP